MKRFSFVLFFLFFAMFAFAKDVMATCGNIILDPGYEVDPGTIVTVNLYNCSESAASYNIQVGSRNVSVSQLTNTQYVATLSGLGVNNYNVIINESGTPIANIGLTVGSPLPGGQAGGTADRVSEGCDNTNFINTGIGCVPINDINALTQFFLSWALGIAGGVSLLLIGLSSFKIATSQGDPRRLQGGQELLMSAIGGLLMVVLSVYLLRFIGVDLLGLF